MTENAVRLAGVTRRYGPVVAVRRLDLTIPVGQTVALLGPNGAGKSTTLNMLLGLTRPDTGTVEILGGSPAAAIRAGRIGAMLQDSGFVADATVRELIELARSGYPHPLPTKRILEIADLGGLSGRLLSKLSGGQKQRVRFAFALAGDPDVLVLDEPTVAMDVASRQAFWAAMRRYAEQGHTILFATHYLEEADDFADRVVVIARGEVVADGTGADIKERSGRRTVSFDLRGASSSGLDLLSGVREVALTGARVTLRTDDADATVTALVHSGRSFTNLEVTGAGLESAFLELTGDPAPAAA